jgi:hypothetical protein
MKKLLILMVLMGTYAVADSLSSKELSNMTLLEQEKLLNKIVKNDSVILSEVRASRKMRKVDEGSRESSTMERQPRTLRVVRKERLVRANRTDTVRVARNSRYERSVIYLAFLR